MLFSHSNDGMLLETDMMDDGHECLEQTPVLYIFSTYQSSQALDRKWCGVDYQPLDVSLYGRTSLLAASGIGSVSLQELKKGLDRIRLDSKRCGSDLGDARCEWTQDKRGLF
jgi:hypothetical protein